MKPRRLLVAPRAQRDLNVIIAWYRREMGALAAAKALRTIRAGIQATTRISLTQAVRTDLPEGFYRVVAKTHLILFRVEGGIAQVVRIVHAARDIKGLLSDE